MGEWPDPGGRATPRLAHQSRRTLMRTRSTTLLYDVDADALFESFIAAMTR